MWTPGQARAVDPDASAYPPLSDPDPIPAWYWFAITFVVALVALALVAGLAVGAWLG